MFLSDSIEFLYNRFQMTYQNLFSKFDLDPFSQENCKLEISAPNWQINLQNSDINLLIDGLFFQYFQLQCACTYFFAVKTLRFTCLSIRLLCDRNTITTQIREL